MQNSELNQKETDIRRFIADQLSSAKTIAIIGCSANPGRTSRRIAGYLKKNDYKIIPVNPNEESILGEHVYDSIEDIPESVSVDIVDIFRNKKYTADMVREIVNRFKDNETKPLIWTQLDVSSDEAKRVAEENDFEYIENRCIYVDHKNLVAQ
ncbi:MAG TPA: CoA-binding protein [Balneolaceae bacterium]|nr:CoA-binding protein [Balneolaceae bacterium]